MPANKLIKTYTAGAAIPAKTLVKFSADRTVVPAAAATDAIIGVSTEVAAASGDPVDIIREGLAEVIANGAITRGAYVTSDAGGLAVAAAPGTGTTAQTIGICEVTAAAGDMIDIMVVRGQLTTP